MDTINIEKKLIRVEDGLAEKENIPIPLCKFCSKPLIRLPQENGLKAGYTCDCEAFQTYVYKANELSTCRKVVENLEQKILTLEQELTDLGKESDYYKLVENAIHKKMESKNKTSKEKVVSFTEVKSVKDMVDETRALTEKYYFYPFVT